MMKLTYRGFKAIDIGTDVLSGKIVGYAYRDKDSSVKWESESEADVEEGFRKAVDDYLADQEFNDLAE